MDGPAVSSEESEGEASEGDDDFDAEEDEETPKKKKGKAKAAATKGKQSGAAAAASAGKVCCVPAVLLGQVLSQAWFRCMPYAKHTALLSGANFVCASGKAFGSHANSEPT
jgi:hypothetical protein